MTLPKLPNVSHRKDAKGAKDFRPYVLPFFAFFAPLRWVLLFPVLLIGTLWLVGCAGTRESVSEFLEGVRVLFDPSAGEDVATCPVRFTALPRGLRTAVCFGWDVEGAEALELAGLLEQYGWRGTLFFPHKLEGEEGMAVADGILQAEARGVEVGCRTSVEETVDMVRCAAEGKAFWDAFVGRPVVSFGAVGAIVREDLNRLADMGYLSVYSRNRVIMLGNSGKERLMISYRFFPDHREDVANRWIEVRGQEGGVFYVWGRSRDSDADKQPWEELESLLAEYGRMEDVWYCTQGELAAYFSARDRSRIVRLKGEKNELCIGIEAGQSVPRTWCPALTVEVRARPSSVVMVLVEEQPVSFEVRGDLVLFDVETTW